MPHSLRAGLEAELAATTPKVLAGRVEELSARYRAVEADPQRPFVQSEQDAGAYAAYRMPATFAAVHAALSALRASAPELQRPSLLDVGAGPGTALWATAEAWPDLRAATLIERDARMIALGQRLARHATAPVVRDATWLRADAIHGGLGDGTYTLVVAAYVLGEISPEQRDDFVTRLWARSAEALVIVEPGTPRGFAAIRRARDLLCSGAGIAAPCPHDAACPMPGGDWCHVAQRITRTPLHRGAKAATLAYEDEKFSYIAATRGAVPARAPRVLRHPQTRKGLVILDLCTPCGLQRRTISRRDGAAYRAARDATWGSTFAAGDDNSEDTVE